MVRPLADQQLIGDDSQRIEIRTKRMILPEQNLRRHVSRRATGLKVVLRLPIPGNPQIRNPSIAVGIQDNVLRFDIAVYNVPLMQMVQSLSQAPH